MYLTTPKFVVQGRSMYDNILIVYKILHSFQNKNKKTKYMAEKNKKKIVDLESYSGSQKNI